MTRHVPYQNSYDIAKKREKFQGYLLLASTAFTIGSIVLNSIDPKTVQFDITECSNLINALSSVFAGLYILSEILVNDKFYNSTKEKHLDLIDHAFDKQFSGDKSVDYFNAQGVRPGIYKLAVMTFENSLFTSAIAKQMTFPKWVLVFVISVIFILSACIGETAVVNNIIQIAATGVLIQQAIRLQFFSNRMNAIHSEFKILFTDLKEPSKRYAKEADIIRNILNYESTHSWGCILLDSKTFDKLNPELSKKWESMKKTYNIN